MKKIILIVFFSITQYYAMEKPSRLAAKPEPQFGATEKNHEKEKKPQPFKEGQAHLGNGKDLFDAVHLHQKERFKQLIAQEGIELNWRDPFGATPLSEAAGRNDMEKARALLNAGANFNLCNDKGWTPLMKAASFGHVEMVELLLSSGAKATLRNKDDNTARDVVVSLIKQGFIKSYTGQRIIYLLDSKFLIKLKLF